MILPQNIDSSKFSTSTETYSNFYEIWHSQQTEHAYYECNTRQYLEHLHDYRFRMIISSGHGTIIL